MRKWALLASVCIMIMMLNLDFTIVNIAIPDIAYNFNASLTDISWVMINYMLFSAIFLILAGKIGNNYGRKKMFVIGIFIFIISSVFCGLSINKWMLIFFRAIQGFSVAITFPLIFVLGLKEFDKTKHLMLIGIISSVAGLFQTLGPTIGGMIIHLFNWRWIFFINVPFGICVIFLVYYLCPKDEKLPKEFVDYNGFVLFFVALCFLIYTLNEWQSLKKPLFALLLLVSVLFLIFFYFFEKKKEVPLVDFQVFNNKAFFATNLVKMVFQYGLYSLVFILVLYLQNIVGFSIIKTGSFLIILGSVFFVTAFFSDFLVKKIGFRLSTFIGLLFFSLSFFLFSQFDIDLSIIQLIMALIFSSFALALLFPSTRIVSYISFAYEESVTTSSIFFTNALMASSIGVAISSSILFFESNKHILRYISTKEINLTADTLPIALKAAHGIIPIDKLKNYFPQEILEQLIPVVKRAFMHGFSKNMLVCMVLSIISIGFTFFMKKEEFHT